MMLERLGGLLVPAQQVRQLVVNPHYDVPVASADDAVVADHPVLAK